MLGYKHHRSNFFRTSNLRAWSPGILNFFLSMSHWAAQCWPLPSSYLFVHLLDLFACLLSLHLDRKKITQITCSRLFELIIYSNIFGPLVHFQLDCMQKYAFNVSLLSTHKLDFVFSLLISLLSTLKFTPFPHNRYFINTDSSKHNRSFLHLSSCPNYIFQGSNSDFFLSLILFSDLF